jgi:hypothetical protein
MNNENVISFKEALLSITDMPTKAWIYLPADKKWNLNSKCAVLESDEVPPELEDKPDAGVPAFAKQNDLMQVLPVTVMQDISKNVRLQKSVASLDDIFQAFQYYYKHDAFIRLNV